MSDQSPANGTLKGWNVILIEDDDQMRNDVIEFFAGHTVAGRPVEITTFADFDAALKEVAERRADLIILDVFRGSALDRGDTAGLQVLEALQASGFVSVVLYTAHPEKVEDKRSPFVRLVGKDVGGIEKLGAEVESLFGTRVPQSFRAVVEHLDTVLKEYMWGFVAASWEQLEGISGSPEFLRVLIRRLAASMNSDRIDVLVRDVFGEDPGQIAPGKVHPAEYHIMPPLDPHSIRMGDIRVRDDEAAEYLIVVWPTCDMVVTAERQPKTDRVLCVRAEPARTAEEIGPLSASSSPSKNLIKQAKATLQNKRGTSPDRYHFVPGLCNLPDLLVDFQKVEVLPFESCLGLKCESSLASPFAESVSSRFLNYIGRIGTPDLDLEFVLSRIAPAS